MNNCSSEQRELLGSPLYKRPNLEKWVENPYWQYFCGYEYFQHEWPCHPTSLVKWRQRIKADAVEEELLAVATGIISRVRRTHAAIANQSGPLLPAAQNDAAGARDILQEQLTEAEQRAAQIVARGLSNKEIAAQQGGSVRTVETHISHILVKKGFRNRVEIARFVTERTPSETPA